jgi:hypothetical protein
MWYPAPALTFHMPKLLHDSICTLWPERYLHPLHALWSGT